MINLGLLDLSGVPFSDLLETIRTNGAQRGANIEELQEYAANHPDEICPGTYIAPGTTRRRQGHTCVAVLNIVDLGHCVRQYVSCPPVEGSRIDPGGKVAVIYESGD